MSYRMMLLKLGLKKGFSSKYILLFYLFSSLISIVVQYFLWQAVLVNRPLIEFKQTLSYLILMQLLSILFPKSSYDLNDQIRSGDIALDLLKPVSIATQLFWESLGYSITKLVIVGGVDLALYFWVLDFQFNLLAVLLVLVTGVLAYILYFELELILGTFTFYTYSIWGIATFKEALLLILAGNVFPAYFYPQVLKQVASYLPFQYSFSAVGMLAQTPSWQLFLQIVVIQIGYIIFLILLFKVLFKWSSTKTVIQGG
ncbi:ABC-2 family transporter protein [Lactobacillus sp. ESL0225]|uniref:ABC-2 family transporter protein n=1 Tax=Lactobacillus sp. ESL0225 TaxID=2069351 RepID=UPI000EFB60B6|nr:ABC-2 family transporter protein [Lactobacillus sp. ESL0225]RMC47999.1 antibiotic ABC transporter permease [Lactobacillus sp. ESL0225]